MRVSLINPKVAQDYSGPRAKIYPPLGLLSLATCLKNELGSRLEISVLDEVIEEAVPDSIYKNDLVCIGVNSFNYENGIRHAKKAKDSGATVVLGGPHATILPENILRLRTEVDFVIAGEGEKSLAMLICEIANKTNRYQEVPNLFYRQGSEVKSSGKKFENDLRDLPVIDRSYLPIEKYINNYRLAYKNEIGNIGYLRPASLYSSKGCSWRDKSGGCVFCARLEKNVRFRTAQQIWEEISLLVNEHNIDHIWDISDDNLNDPEWFSNFVSLKPKAINPKFLVYSRASAINKAAIEWFKRLNVHEIYVGFESGDPEMLRAAKKGSSQEHHLRIIELIAGAGINIYPSFVLGLPGETESSLANTMKFVRQITQICRFYRISATKLIPIPGSMAFKMLAQHGSLNGKNYPCLDTFDLKTMEKEWAELFTSVGYDTLSRYCDEINNLNIKGVWS